MELQELLLTGNKEKPLWTLNVFAGDAPEGFKNWPDWINRSTEHGLFSGVYIRAATAEDWAPNKT